MTNGLPTAPSILLASRDQWVAPALESVLRSEGYQVHRVSSGRDLLARALAGAVDALITDDTLSDLHPLDVCRVLRADPEVGARLPVLLVLPRPLNRTLRLDAHQAGAWQIFGHPLDVQLLICQLALFVNASRSSSLPACPATSTSQSRRPCTTAELALKADRLREDAAARQLPLAIIVIRVRLVSAQLAADDQPCRIVPDADLMELVGTRLCAWQRATDVIGHLDDLALALLAPATDHDGARSIVRRLQLRFRTAHWPIPSRLRLVTEVGIRILDDFTMPAASAEQLLGEARSSLGRQGLWQDAHEWSLAT